MLSLSGEGILKPLSEDTYISSFKFKITKYKDRPNGDPEKVFIRPVFFDGSDVLQKAFIDYNAEPLVTMTSDRRSIEFKVSKDKSSKWTLSTASYEFIDKNGEVLTETRFPVFVPNSVK